MRYVSTYERFLEKKELDSLFERFEFIFESDNPLNIKIQSEEELLEETPEDQKAEIEDIITKHFPETKGEINLDANKPLMVHQQNNTPPKLRKEPVLKESISLAITIASLIPIAMEAIGTFSNFLKRKFGINLNESQMEKIKLMNDAITVLKKLKGGDKDTKVERGIFLNREWKRSGWDALCNALANKLGMEELKAGIEEHKHSDKFLPNLAMNKSDRLVTRKEKIEKEKQLKRLKKGKGGNTLLRDEVGHQIGLEIQKIKNKRDELFGSDFGNWIKEKAHKLHNLYTTPIRLALYGLSRVSKSSSKLRKEEFRTKIANIIYAITMISLAGFGIWGSMSHLAGVGDVTSIVLKGLESGAISSELRRQAIQAIMH